MLTLTTAFVLVRGSAPGTFEVISMLMSAGAVYLKCAHVCTHVCTHVCMHIYLFVCMSMPEVHANVRTK